MSALNKEQTEVLREARNLLGNLAKRFTLDPKCSQPLSPELVQRLGRVAAEVDTVIVMKGWYSP